jgi:hypothetical protein
MRKMKSYHETLHGRRRPTVEEDPQAVDKQRPGNNLPSHGTSGSMKFAAQPDPDFDSVVSDNAETSS